MPTQEEQPYIILKEVRRTVKSFKSKKATDYDEISMDLMSEAGDKYKC